MGIQNTCCVTGHRDISWKTLKKIRQLLEQEINQAISEGYTCFIIGGADDGLDILFAELVLELRDKGRPITLEAAIPYRNCLKSKHLPFQAVISQCDAINIVMEKYQKSCFFARDRDIVQKSSLVIAVYDGREFGSTDFTIRYAQLLQKNVRIISI